MIDQRVHVAGADREEQPRPAELPPRFARMPIGLAEHGDAKAGLLQNAMQDRHREAGMIDVGVAGDEDDVDGVPAARSISRREIGASGAVGGAESGSGHPDSGIDGIRWHRVII